MKVLILLFAFHFFNVIVGFISHRKLTLYMPIPTDLFHRKLSTRNKISAFKVYMSTSFYNSIGSPKFISAPMVDQSNLAWRILVRKNGADLAFAQMMHARNFVNDKKYRADCIDWNDYSNNDGEQESLLSSTLDRPLIVQLAGDDPDILVRAGRLMHHDVTAIDLNLGCPQRIAKKGHYGAYLLPEKSLVLSCLSAMVKGLDCPVTAKIRRLPSDEETIELCQEMERCGVQMITVHGRTVDSNKLFIGPADWDIIRRVKEAVSIPVIANGGVSCRDDALRCLETTGADGIMSSEALLENPKMFSVQGDDFFRREYVKAQLQTVDDYLKITMAHRLPRPLFQVVRSHLFKMLYRFMDAPAHLDLRERLATGTLEEMVGVVEEVRRRLAAVDFDTAEAEARGLINGNTWYMRHRNERSARRVISPMRSRAPNGGSSSSLDAAEFRINTVSTEQKLASLKARLLEKKRQPASVSGDNDRSQSYSKFMARVDS